MQTDRTILVTHAAGQAEAIQCLLGAHGIKATLWDDNAMRGQTNQAISIALQVAEEDVVRAFDILKREQPDIFPPPGRAEKIEAEMKRAIMRFFADSLGIGFVCFFVVARNGELLSRCWAAWVCGLVCAIPVAFLRWWIGKRGARHKFSDATPGQAPPAMPGPSSGTSSL